MIVNTRRGKLTESESEHLIALHSPLVKAIAKSLLRKLPANVELDDLVQDGYIGLLAAILQTTKERAGNQFQHYLSQRVRGAMLDGLRENDPGTRRVRHEMRRVEHVIQELGHQLGRSPNEHEVAISLGVQLIEYQRLLQEAHGYALFSLEDFSDDDSPREFLDWCLVTKSDPFAALERRALQRKLLIAISDLSSREAEVMTLFYVDDFPMADIADHFNITQGRVSQIHAQAVAKLRAAVIGVDDRPTLLAPRRRQTSMLQSEMVCA